MGIQYLSGDTEKENEFLVLNPYIIVGSLCLFPPESVKLRKPFAIQPWINSEENVGNLLMVCSHHDFLLPCNITHIKQCAKSLPDLDATYGKLCIWLWPFAV